jgi:hypothetical protein
VGRRRLSFAVIAINAVMWLPSGRSPQFRERIELESQARVPGRHDAMGREFVVRLILFNIKISLVVAIYTSGVHGEYWSLNS